MKIQSILQLISDAAQATAAHTPLCSDLEEANAQIPAMQPLGGVVVVLDTGAASNFEYNPSLGQELYTLRLYAVVKQQNIDTPRNQIDSSGTAEAVLQALAKAVQPDNVPGTLTATVRLSSIVSEKGLFDDDFGGASATLTFTRLFLC